MRLHIITWQTIVAATLGMSLGCGMVDSLDSAQDLRSRLTNHNHSSAGDSSTPTPESPVAQVPLETSIPNRLLVPLRYKGTTLNLTLASNGPEAAFECRLWPSREFIPCSKPRSHTLTNLVHGRTYTVEVRSRTSAQVDDTPTRLSFLSDQISGSDLLAAPASRGVTNSAAGKEQLPSVQSELPSVTAAPNADQGIVDFGAAGVAAPAANDAAARRTIALGRRFGVVVPFNLQVASWASTHTYNQTTLLVFDPAERAFASNCNFSWEVLDRTASRPTCRATPSSAGYAQYYAPQRSANHVEMVRKDGSETVEGWFFAASESSQTLSQSMGAGASPLGLKMPPDYSCPTGGSSGQIPLLTAWRDYFEHGTGPVMMNWCSYFRDGAWWWVANAAIPVGSMVGATNGLGAANSTVTSTLIVGYKGRADQGIQSWNEVQRRFEPMVNRALIPTAP